MTIRLAVVLLILAAPAGAPAQDSPDADEIRRRMDEILRPQGREIDKPASPPRSLGALAPPGDATLPQVVPECPAEMSAETQAECQSAWREYLAYFKFGLSQRREVFEWQLFSSRIIFWVVLSLVVAGIYFAAVQFQHGLRRQPSATSAEDVTEFAASLAGVRVRSPVLGVIILVISFGFFYLYLRFVYPITTTF